MTDDDEDDATKARPRVGNSATAITSLQNNRPSIVFRFGSWTLFLGVVVVVVVVVVMVVFLVVLVFAVVSLVYASAVGCVGHRSGAGKELVLYLPRKRKEMSQK